jgi:hypothetical protein
MYYFKLFFIILIICITIYQIIYPTLFRLENKKQIQFLELNNIDTKIYKTLVDYQNRILEKKTYIIPELSFKISDNYFNNSRYILPIEFKLLNSIYFDSLTDYIFDKALEIDNGEPDSLDLKATILDKLELLSGNSNFVNYGDIIIGFDEYENNNKIYFDTNNYKIHSYEWNKFNYSYNKYRLYEESTYYDYLKTLFLIDKTYNENFSKFILEMADEENIRTILARTKKYNNVEITDSFHICLNNPIIINENFINLFEKLSKKIFNYSNKKIKKFFELNNKKKIHWFSITYLENDNYLDMNFYFRDENISDAILQYLQIPLQLYFPKN